MGIKSTLYGYIEEAHLGWAGGGDPIKIEPLRKTEIDIIESNKLALNSLPDSDFWPAMPKSIFSMVDTSKVSGVAFRNTPIHFAACFEELDFSIGDWLNKFETLLKEMYWEYAVVQFRGAYIGEHMFSYRPKREWVTNLCNGNLKPITEWDFYSSLEQKGLNAFRSERE